MLAAAVSIVDDEGWDALTVTRLAEATGLRPSSLYRHVGGIDDVRREVRVASTRELSERALRAVAGRSTDAGVHALAHACRTYAREHPGRYLAFARLSVDDIDFHDAGAGLNDAMLGVIGSFRIEGDSLFVSLAAMRSMLHGFIDLELAGLLPAVDHDLAFDALVDDLAVALHRRARTTTGG